MRRLRNTQFNRKSWKKFVYNINEPQGNQKRSANFGHKMRCVEDVQSLKDAKTDQYVYNEYAKNVGTPDFQDA